MIAGLRRRADRFRELVLARPLLWAVVLGLLLAAPTMLMQFFTDDHILLSVCRAETVGGRDGSAHTRYLADRRDAFGMVSLYSFADGTLEDHRAAVASGFVPWWSVEGVKLHLWRPVSSYLGLLDYVLFGENPFPYHLHSAAWYLAMIAACWSVLRRTLPRSVAVLALVLYVLDESHITPVGWIANRHALIAGTFGLLGLAAHLRWCQEGWRPGGVLSMPLFALAFLAGEMALGVMAFVLAHAMFWPGRGTHDESPNRTERSAVPDWRWRLLHALPVVAVTAAWALIYKLNGFGGWGMGSYVDPVSAPGVFLLAAGPRAAVLFGNILGGPAGEVLTFIPGSLPVLVTLGVILIGAVAAWLRHAWPDLEPAERATLRWVIPGTLLSALPMLSAEQMSRHTLIAGLGGSVVLAVLIRSGRRAVSRQPKPSGRAWRALPIAATALAIWHLTVVPVSRYAGLAAMELVSRPCTRHAREAVALLAEEGNVASRNVIMLNAPHPFAGVYLASGAYHMDTPFPASWHWLPLSRDDLEMRRPDEHELQLVVKGRAFLTPGIQIMGRTPDAPLKLGDTTDCGPFTVTIDELSELHEPTRVTLRFSRSLEDTPLILLAWRDDGPHIVEVPAVGGATMLSVQRPWHALVPE